MDSMLKIKYGLFNQSFWRHPVAWLHDLKIYFDRRSHLLKHGYSPMCNWEYTEAFLELSKQVFTYLRHKRVGNILIPPTEPEEVKDWKVALEHEAQRNNDLYDGLLADIKVLQDYGCGAGISYKDDAARHPEVEKAKQHLLDTISKYFWDFWD